MAGTVRELLTRWGFETDTKPIERFNKSISDAKTTIALVGAQAIAQAGALFGLADSVATTGDAFAKTADRIGFSVETLQEYSHVAKLAGSSTDEMNGAIEGLTLSISEAKKGGGNLIEPLIRLNQLTGKDLLSSMGNADDLMLKLSDTFASMTDETEKAELATKIFGGSGLAMVSVLNQGSEAINKQKQEARELGIVLSAKVAKQSEMFKDSLLRVQQVFIGLRNSVGVELIPIITEIMDQFKEWVKVNKEWLKGGIETVIRSMVSGTKKLFIITGKMFKVVKALVNAFGGLETILKVVIASLTVFTAVKFLSTIGNMTIAVGLGLANAFKSAGNSALWAQAKMALFPIMVGLAIASVALLIEDLLAFFQGRDSLTGKILSAIDGLDISAIIVKKLDEASEAIKKFSEQSSVWLAGIFDFENLDKDIARLTKAFFDMFSTGDFGDGVGGAIFDLGLNIFQAIGDALIITVRGIVSAVFDVIKGLGGGLLDFSGKDGSITKGVDAVKGFFGFGGEDKNDLSKNINSVGGGGLDKRPNLRLLNGGNVPTGGLSNNSTTNNNSVSVSVNVPQGTSSKEASNLVEQGVTNALNRMARETQAATVSNVER